MIQTRLNRNDLDDFSVLPVLTITGTGPHPIMQTRHEPVTRAVVLFLVSFVSLQEVPNISVSLALTETTILREPEDTLVIAGAAAHPVGLRCAASHQRGVESCL